jgi:hypothetical protein
MPLRPGPRPHAHPAVHAAVRRLRDRRKGAPLGAQGGPALELALPHEVWDIPLDALAAGRGLGAARLTGVRHLVMEGHRVVAAAEAADAAPDAPHLHLGAAATAMADAVHVAEALPDVLKGAFEPRLLRCAGLPLVALWLHGEAADLAIPLPPRPPGVDARPWRVADLLDAVRATAAVRLGHKLHP